MAARFDAVRLFIFVLILLIQPHSTLWLKGPPYRCYVWGRVYCASHNAFVLHLALARV